MNRSLLFCGALAALGIGAVAQAAVRNLYLAGTDGYVYMPDDGAGLGNPRKVWIRGFVGDTAPGACYGTGTPAPGDFSAHPEACPNGAALRGRATLPAPIIDVNLGDDVFVTLSNVGNLENVAPDPHTVHLHGLKSATQNDGFNEFSWAVPIGYAATYYFKAERPGTFMYHCHVEASEHIQMGMYGALIIRPTRLDPHAPPALEDRYPANPQTVYGGAYNDYFDLGSDGKPQEYIMLLSDVDPVWHEGVRTNFTNTSPGNCNGQFELPNNQGGVSRCIDLTTFNPSDFLPRYWLVNGRSFPDTLALGGLSADQGPAAPGAGPPTGHFPCVNQPPATCNNNLVTYRTFIDVKMGNKGAPAGSGPRFMVRVIGFGYAHEAHHFHGPLLTVVGEDANPIPLWQQHPEHTMNVASGKTYEVIIAPDCLAGFGLDSMASHSPGEAMVKGATSGPVGAALWDNGPPLGIVSEPLFPLNNDLSVQVWPVHSHYDYQVTNNGAYPGGALQLIRATNPACR
jgi:FtsP/CotA-like multicopper oxidase with cupredoxin domain